MSAADWFADAAAGVLERRSKTIEQLRARVAHLEAALENFDTVDAENFAVHQVITKLNRILDERRQVGTFGSPRLQLFAERILELSRGYYERRGTSG